MSAAALAMLSPESKCAVKSSAKTLRVNEPGDAYEREADKVADTVASGGRISNWSLSASSAGLIQRDSNTAAALPPQSSIRKVGDPQDPPASNNYGDMLGKLAEAFLKTDAGKTIARYLEDQPIVKDAKDFVQTPTGIVVAGSTAIAAISGLAAAGKGLPAQLPAIPLDKLYPGLSVKVDVEGPLNHPTQGSLMVSFGAASPKKKKGGPTETDKYRAETQRMAERMKFGAGVDPGKLGPGAPSDLEKQSEDKRERSDAVSRMSAILQPNAPHAPGTFTPLVPGTQPMSLHMRDDIATDTPRATTKDESKKEEIPVQRKAESVLDYQQDAASDVDAVLNSSGQPLDRETRRTMESRFGFDFSKVRIHADTRAGASSRSLGARAYTVGNNVVFAPGRFAPHTTEGRRLLAHELTHVVQQSPNRAAMPLAIRPAPVHIQRDADEEPGRLQKIVAQIPGYTLFTVIIGYDPLQRKDVERNAIALVREFLKLIHKEEVFNELEKSHTLEDASAWLKERFDRLNFSRDMFIQLGKDALKAFGRNILSGTEAIFRAVSAVFQPTIQKVLDLGKEVITKLGEILFKYVMKWIGGEEILATLEKARDTFEIIIRNPVAFIRNLFAALKQGFEDFGKDALSYIKGGLLAWLTDELKSAGITLPKTLNLKEIGGIVLQVLGITKENFRKLVVEEIGEETLSRIEKGVAGGLDILREVQEQGPIALWNRALAYVKDLTDMVVTALGEWIGKVIITEAVKRLAPLLTPIGAAVEVVLDVIKTVQIVFDQIRKLAALVKGIVDAIAEIASANIGPAAAKIVDTLVKAIPVVISFLAGYIGLKDVGKAIGDTLETVRKPIRDAASKAIKFAADKARAAIGKVKETAAKVLNWWKQRKEVTQGNEKHSIYLDGTEDEAKLMIASDPAISWTEFLVEKAKKAAPEQKSIIDQLRLDATALEQRLPRSKDAAEKEANIKAKEALFEKVANAIVALGLHRDSVEPVSVVNFGTAREDGGATSMKASPLSTKFKDGSRPFDNPKIWTALGSLIRTKFYKRGHLLNENLGGFGFGQNLTPFNTKANSDHLSMIEDKIKTLVLEEPKHIMSYTVDVEYSSHPSKPKQMLELEKRLPNIAPDSQEQKDLEEFRAEQRLCTGLKFEAHELEHNGTEWVDKKNSVNKFNGRVPHNLDL